MKIYRYIKIITCTDTCEYTKKNSNSLINIVGYSDEIVLGNLMAFNEIWGYLRKFKKI